MSARAKLLRPLCFADPWLYDKGCGMIAAEKGSWTPLECVTITS